MSEVSVGVELRVAVGPGADPVGLEHAIARQGRHATKELYREVLQFMDQQSTEASGGSRQRLECRWVATTLGRLRIFRYRVKGEGGSFHPLDRALGLAQAEASPALREVVCDLACRLPYRQVSEVAGRPTGEALAAGTCWRILQAEGARVPTEEGELVGSVFELGQAPPETSSPPRSWWWRPTGPAWLPSARKGTASRSRPGCSTPARNRRVAGGGAGGGC